MLALTNSILILSSMQNYFFLTLKTDRNNIIVSIVISRQESFHENVDEVKE